MERRSFLRKAGAGVAAGARLPGPLALERHAGAIGAAAEVRPESSAGVAEISGRRSADRRL